MIGDASRKPRRPITKSAQNASAGRSPHMPRYILPALICLVLIAFVIILAFGFY